MAKKPNKIIIILSVILAVVLIICIYKLIKSKNTTDTEITVSLDNKSVFEFDGRYYYSNDFGVFSADDNSLIINYVGEKIISSNSDDIYLYDVKTGFVFIINPENKELEKVVDIPQNAQAFSVADSYIIYVADKNVKCISLSDYSDISCVQTDNYTLNKISNAFEAYEYLVADDKYVYISDLTSAETSADSSSFYIFNDEHLKTITDKYWSLFLSGYTDDELIIGYPRNYHPPCIVKYSKDNEEIIATCSMKTNYCPIGYVADNKNIVCVGIMVDNDPYSDYTPELDKHISDFITVVEVESFEITDEKEFKKGERVLFADSQKAITYYKGQYLTYSLSDWKVIKKQNADEIKNGGSYTFESCGEYIFVFDDKQDKLINTIGI